MATIQIPVLFDMSGDTIVYGEEASGDFVSSHLEFVLDMTTEANDISLNAADISSAILVGDQDTGDNIFYSGGSTGNIGVDNLCNRIAKAITRGKLVHLPKTGNTSNSGIPMGGRANLYDLNGVYTENGNNDKYAIKYNTSIAPIGDEQMLGQAMARIASIHLVGSPLSAGIFQDKNQVQTDLETASSQTFNSGNTAFYNALAVQLSKVLGGSKSSAPMNSGYVSEFTPSVNWTQQALINPSGINTNTITTTVTDGQNDGYKATNGLHGQANSWESWRSGSKYRKTSGFHGTDAVFTTTYNTNQTVTGAWVQIDLGAAFAVTKYGIAGIESNPFGAGEEANARDALLLGSNDDSTWTLVDTYSAAVADYFTGGTPSTDVANLIENENTINATYRYWRFAVTQLLVEDSTTTNDTTDRYLAIGEFSLYDANNNNISLTAIRPINHSGPTIVVTASEDDGNKAKNNNVLQDGIHSEASRWKCHTGNGPFSTNANGDVTIHKGTTTLVGGGTYAGPWVSYDLGADATIGKVGIGGYRLMSSTDNALRDIVRDATVLGSSDNTNWNIVHEITNIDPLSYLSSGVYNGNWNTVQAHEIEFTTAATYRYWRLVIRATSAPPNTTRGNIVPTMTELSFFKYDVSQKTYQGPLDASGTGVPALKSIYEQLMNVPGRSQIMQTRDVGGVVDNSNSTITGGFPFISGDKLVVYLRPKINFAAQTQPEQHSTALVGFPDKVMFDVPVYNIADISGSITSQTYSQSSAQDNSMFGFHRAVNGLGVDGNYYFTSAGGTYSGGDYIGDKVTRNIGLTKNVTVTTARLQNNNQIVDTEDLFIYGVGFVNYLDIEVGDTVTYQHPTLGSQTTTVSQVNSGGSAPAKPYMIILTDAHNVNVGTAIGSCTFHNKKEGVAGEWGQVNIGASTYVQELSLTTNNSYVNRMPSDFMLLGSNDGANWTKMIHATDEVRPWTASTPRTFSTDVAKAFTYYRYVVIKGPVSDGRTSLGYFNLKGSLATEAFIQVGGKAGDPGFQPIASAVENIPGLITNFTATPQNIVDAFPGNATSGPESESLKWSWMGSANSDTLSLDTTDINDTGTIDLHIWKITITL